MSYEWVYLTFKYDQRTGYGKLHTDNGRLYVPTRDNQFRTESEADQYLRDADLRATIR